MSLESIGILLAVLASLVTSIIALRKAPDETKLVKADAYSKLETVVTGLTESLGKETVARKELLDEFLKFKRESSIIEADLRVRIRGLETVVGRLHSGISRLIEQITSIGHTPVWIPEEIKEHKKNDNL